MQTELYFFDINKIGKIEKGRRKTRKEKKRKVQETTNQKTAECKKNEKPLK